MPFAGVVKIMGLQVKSVEVGFGPKSCQSEYALFALSCARARQWKLPISPGKEVVAKVPGVTNELLVLYENPVVMVFPEPALYKLLLVEVAMAESKYTTSSREKKPEGKTVFVLLLSLTSGIF